MSISSHHHAGGLLLCDGNAEQQIPHFKEDNNKNGHRYADRGLLASVAMNKSAKPQNIIYVIIFVLFSHFFVLCGNQPISSQHISIQWLSRYSGME